MTTEYGTRQVKGDRLNYLGGNYKPLDGLEISLYGSHFQDVWNQYYPGVTHDIGDLENGIALRTAFNGYHTGDTGARGRLHRQRHLEPGLHSSAIAPTP
ncbi:OprD family outer membrane porin [Pseudomonas aeruginosa]